MVDNSQERPARCPFHSLYEHPVVAPFMKLGALLSGRSEPDLSQKEVFRQLTLGLIPFYKATTAATVHEETDKILSSKGLWITSNIREEMEFNMKFGKTLEGLEPTWLRKEATVDFFYALGAPTFWENLLKAANLQDPTVIKSLVDKAKKTKLIKQDRQIYQRWAFEMRTTLAKRTTVAALAVGAGEQFPAATYYDEKNEDSEGHECPSNMHLTIQGIAAQYPTPAADFSEWYQRITTLFPAKYPDVLNPDKPTTILDFYEKYRTFFSPADPYNPKSMRESIRCSGIKTVRMIYEGLGMHLAKEQTYATLNKRLVTH